MTKELTYIDMDGHQISLVHLDSDERKIVQALKQEADRNPDWDAFDNFWAKQVLSFYDARGLDRHTQTQTALFQIAVDLSLRLGIASGQIASRTYQGDLRKIIRDQFNGVKRGLCKATGISEDMLSHVLAGRKDFSLTSLATALEKIGYTLRILPQPTAALTTRPKPGRNSTAKPAAAKKTTKKVG